jgi:hypothetical protein
VKGLTGGFLVSLVCAAPLLAQERDRSLERISVALEKPHPAVPTVDFQGDFPKQLGIVTLVQPTRPGEVIRVAMPIGELVSHAFKSVGAANQRRKEAAARRQVETALKAAGFSLPPR